MLIGYARLISGAASEKNQRSEARHKLAEAKCEQTFFETATPLDRREILTRIIAQMSPKDLLVVPALEHLGRTHKELFDTLTLLQERRLQFAIANRLVAATAHERAFLVSCVAAFTSAFTAIASEQTRRGKRVSPDRDKGGRPRKMTDARALEVLALLEEGKQPEEIASQLRLRLGDIVAEMERLSTVSIEAAVEAELKKQGRMGPGNLTGNALRQAGIPNIEAIKERLLNRVRDTSKLSKFDLDAMSPEEQVLRRIFGDPRLPKPKPSGTIHLEPPKKNRSRTRSKAPKMISGALSKRKPLEGRKTK